MSEIKNNTIAENNFITQLLDTQPDAVVWFFPLFGAKQGGPVDFEVGYCNSAAAQILKASRDQITGARIQSTILMDADSRKQIFNQCMEVWTTGNHVEYTYYSPGMDKYFNVQRSKIQNGILSITRDHTLYEKMQQEKKDQWQLLNKIIETSTSGISLYEAMRDQEGKIADFRLKLANQKAAELTGFTLEELYKYTVKELMVIRGQTGYFDVVSRVVETGEPLYTEHYSQQGQWIAFSIKKFNDGYLLNYIDISQTKALEKKAQEQADMLQGIFNATNAGLITLESITDAAGNIIDFKLTVLNQAAEKMFGIKDEDKHKTYLTLFPSSRTNGFLELYINALLTGTPVTKEFFYKGEGYNGWYYISVTKMNATTLVQSFNDITHTKLNT